MQTKFERKTGSFEALKSFLDVKLSDNMLSEDLIKF